MERLKNYCAFAHGDIDSAVREALVYVFDRDKDFRTFEQQLRHQPAPDDSSAATTGAAAKTK